MAGSWNLSTASKLDPLLCKYSGVEGMFDLGHLGDEVCLVDHLCEGACLLDSVSEPVSIRDAISIG